MRVVCRPIDAERVARVLGAHVGHEAEITDAFTEFDSLNLRLNRQLAKLSLPKEMIEPQGGSLDQAKLWQEVWGIPGKPWQDPPR